MPRLLVNRHQTFVYIFNIVLNTIDLIQKQFNCKLNVKKNLCECKQFVPRITTKIYKVFKVTTTGQKKQV